MCKGMVFLVFLAVFSSLTGCVNLFYTIELYRQFEDYQTDLNMCLFADENKEDIKDED